MGRHSPVTRLLWLGVTAWLLVFRLEPQALHACAMHSGAHTSAAGGHAAHQMAGHDMTAGHAMAPATDESSAPTGPAQCTCPGGCTMTSPVAPPNPAETATAVAPISVRVEAPRERTALSARDAEFVLPFANGPPATA